MKKFNETRRSVLKGVVATGVCVIALDKAYALTSLLDNGTTGQSGTSHEAIKGSRTDIALNQANIFDDMMFAKTAWSSKYSETGVLSL